MYHHKRKYRALNSGLNIFSHTGSLPRPDGSSHSFYLKFTEDLPCAGQDSKCKDGRVNKTDRVSFMGRGMRDGRGSGSVVGNQQENKRSSPPGAAETNLIRNYEVAGLIPGLTQ